MTRRLVRYVYVTDANGSTVWFRPGDVPPDWAIPKLRNPELWAEEAGSEAAAPEPTSEPDPTPEPEPEAEPEAPQRPPRAGAGASTAAWRAYAEAIGLDVPAGATRDQIIAQVDAAEGG